MIKSFFFPLTLFLAFGCVQSPKPLPEWITHQQSHPDYWYGLGIGNNREDARVRAINEIASQISVNISSTMSGIKTEYNFNVNEFTKQVINSRIDNTIENIEIIDSYEANGIFYLQTRLSRHTYYLNLEKRKNLALDISYSWFLKAIEKIDTQTFILLDQAAVGIEKYLDLDLTVEYPQGTGKYINMWSLIRQSANDLVGRISCRSDKKELHFKYGIPDTKTISVHCTDNLTGDFLKGIPLKMEFRENVYSKSARTNIDGYASMLIERILNKETQQIISITPDIQSIISGYPEWFYATDIVNITAMVEGLKISVIGTEKNLDTKVKIQLVIPILKESLISNYLVKVVDAPESDILILINIETLLRSDKPELISNMKIYQVYANASITVYETKTDREIYQNVISGIKGVSYTSFNDAGIDGLHKIRKKMISENLLSLEDIILN